MAFLMGKLTEHGIFNGKLTITIENGIFEWENQLFLWPFGR